MFSGPVSDHEKVRLELEQHIETAKILINRASAQGRDPRDLQTEGAHPFAALNTLDRRTPIAAEAAADPRAAVSSISSAVLTIASGFGRAKSSPLPPPLRLGFEGVFARHRSVVPRPQSLSRPRSST